MSSQGYYSSVDGVLFIVDAADRTRFAEAREELHALLNEPALQDVPLAILGNKIDIPVAASEEEFRRALGLFQHMTCGGAAKGAARPVEVHAPVVNLRLR
mmetsp:Transcript_132047/g.422993  ORF Transcript_132047/g.422993 Transcript_132047/m.422993 type:complete len:100 (+) Transcript_132047:26-325(+)